MNKKIKNELTDKLFECILSMENRGRVLSAL